MSVEIQGTIVPKNNGTFPVATSEHINHTDGSKMSDIIEQHGTQLSDIPKCDWVYIDKYINDTEDIGITISNLIANGDDYVTYIMSKTSYTYAEPIKIDNKRITLICNGLITYTGNTKAPFILDTKYTNLYVKNIESACDGIIICNESGQNNCYNKIYGNLIKATHNGLSYICTENTTNGGIQYNIADFNKIEGENATYYECLCEKWIGDIYLYNARLSGTNGVVAKGNGTNITRIKHINCGLEALVDGVHLDGVQYSYFDGRQEENLSGKLIVLTGINSNITFNYDTSYVSNILSGITDNYGENINVYCRVMNYNSSYTYLTDHLRIINEKCYYTPINEQRISFLEGTNVNLTSRLFGLNSDCGYKLFTQIILSPNFVMTIGNEYKQMKRPLYVYVNTGVTIKDEDGEELISNSSSVYANKVVAITYIGDRVSTKKWSIIEQDTGSTTVGLTGKYISFGSDISYNKSGDSQYGAFLSVMQESNRYMDVSIRCGHDYYLTRQGTSILDKIDTEIATSNNYDKIFIEGGHTDYVQGGYTLGEFAPTIDELATYNTNTLCGALEYAFSKCKIKWSTANLYYLIPHNMYINELNTIFDTLAQVAVKWGVKVIDMRQSKMDINNLSIKTICFGSSFESWQDDAGIYPNRDGYIKFYIPYILKNL